MQALIGHVRFVKQLPYFLISWHHLSRRIGLNIVRITWIRDAIWVRTTDENFPCFVNPQIVPLHIPNGRPFGMCKSIVIASIYTCISFSTTNVSQWSAVYFHLSKCISRLSSAKYRPFSSYSIMLWVHKKCHLTSYSSGVFSSFFFYKNRVNVYILSPPCL